VWVRNPESGVRRPRSSPPAGFRLCNVVLVAGVIINDGVDHPHFQRFRCKNVKMDKVEMSAVPITAGDGTTHAEPRRVARLIGSATTSLGGVHRAVAVSARCLACGAPPVSSGGRESSKTTRESQTYFHHSRARGRESSSYVDAARGQTDVEIAARRPARHGNVSIPLQPTTWRGVDGRQRARVRARLRRARVRRRKRHKPPKWPFRREIPRDDLPRHLLLPCW